jgi:hypothetical protein
MNIDDGGRRVDGVVGLKQSRESPSHCLSSMGGSPYEEPQSMERHEAENAHASHNSRQERGDVGHVRWRTENRVPDVGGLGWRTKAGHLLKNQAYYSQQHKRNKWDEPTHAGVTTWQDWHGPKIRTDAEMMERLDHFDRQTQDWKAKQTFVNTTRLETLDRFYNRKLNRSQLESSTSWAPHNRAKREVHSSHETFDSGLDEKPQKELQKVMTNTVLRRDREACRQIASRIQNEATWTQVWKQMEQERRMDIRADLQMRQSHTDMLMQMSGQPLRQHSNEVNREVPNSCSDRTLEIARHKDAPEPHKCADITRLTDFRGLYHADNQHALEAMFPGFGHELSTQFRANTTASVEAGFPAPPRPVTPTQNSRSTHREEHAKSMEISKSSVPSSPSRMKMIGGRFDDHLFKQHSKAQFLDNVAPPPLNQDKQLLTEDWSPATSIRDPDRITGTFARTLHHAEGAPTKMAKSTSVHGQFLGHAPPPKRSYVYPVLANTSPTAKMQAGLHNAAHTMDPADPTADPFAFSQTSGACGGTGASSPSATRSAGPFIPPGSPKASGAKPVMMQSTMNSFGMTKPGFQRREKKAQLRKVCDELDNFEATMQAVPRLSNFDSTPRKTGKGQLPQHSSSAPQLAI